MLWTWAAIIICPVIVILLYDRYSHNKFIDLENELVQTRRGFNKLLAEERGKIENIRSSCLENEQLVASLWAEVVGFEGSDDKLDGDFQSISEHVLKERWRTSPRKWRVQIDNVLYEYSRLVKTYGPPRLQVGF